MDTTHGHGSPDRTLTDDEVARICAATLDEWAIDGERVVVLIPDTTRTCPLPALFAHVHRCLAPRVAGLDVLVALGTHAPMTEPEIRAHVGIGDAETHSRRFPKVALHNHAWDEDGVLVEVGRMTAREVEEFSDGQLSIDVPITINRLVADATHVLVLGPVFPHEVAGYSGGNKYLFPGVSGPQIIHFFHWLGALITNRGIIGVKHTPVRAVIDRAAAMVEADRRALCMIVRSEDGGLAGLFGGRPRAAWSRAADLSAGIHVRWCSRSYHTVLSRCPPMYPDLWTAGKCMYKLEPVVADGGELVIWAPHVREVSRVHGRVLQRIGYHVRDYFVAQWDRFRDEPWGVLAHSTHVKGDGAFSAGVERPRVKVTLATGIPERICRQIDLGYRDPAQIDAADFAGREDDGVLFVPKAGELLFRLASERTS